MEILNITLAAGGRATFRKAGGYLEIIGATSAININFYTVDGGQSDSINGGLSGLFLETNYGAFDIIEASGVPQTIQLLVCDPGEAGGSRRQPGDVKIIDSSADKTRLGQQFWGSNGAVAVAGQVSHANIQTTAGDVAIKALAIQSSIAGQVYIATSTAAGTANPIGAGGLAQKYRNGVSLTPAHKTNSGSSLTSAPTGAEIPGYSLIMALYVPANTPIVVPITTPIVLNGARGLVVSSVAVNRDIGWLLDVEEL